MRKTKTDKIIDVCNKIFMLLIIIIMLYPLYFTVIASFSEPRYVATGQIIFLPKGFSLNAYYNVFKNASIWVGYRNTIYYTVVYTAIALFLTLPAAYSLSKKKLRGRTVLSWYFLITMFFNGGLIPTYLLVRDLNLINKPYTLAVLGCFSVWNMVVTRIYYQTAIPDDLYEAAKVDGCSDFKQFFLIAVPLSAPIIAVMALFYAVGKWGDYFGALIYISNSNYYPLQLVLRNILISGQQALAAIEINQTSVNADEVLMLTRQAYTAEAMKYSLIFIASAPLLIAYPFVQKYFVKGVMIGSLKG